LNYNFGEDYQLYLLEFGYDLPRFFKDKEVQINNDLIIKPFTFLK
jgi:hypothetical protein